MRYRLAIRSIIYSLLLCLSLQASAETYYYDVSTNNTADAGYFIYSTSDLNSNAEVDANTNGHLTLAAAAAFNHSISGGASGAWSDGDKVNLKPGKIYASGGLVLNDTASSGTWFELNGNGAVVSRTNSASGHFVIEIQNSSVALRNVTLRGYGSNGGELQVDPATGVNMTEFWVDNVLIDAHPSGSAVSPVAFALANGKTASGMISNFRLDAGSGLPDGISVSASGAPNVWGTVWFVNCDISKCDALANANAIALDDQINAIVVGGKFSYCGGPALVGGDFLGFGNGRTARLFVYGAEVWNNNVHSSATSDSHEIAGAEYVDSCWIHNALSGVLLSSTATSASLTGLSTIRNTVIQRDKSRDPTLTDTTLGAFGLTFACLTAVAENCRIEGYENSGSTYSDHAVWGYLPNVVGSRYSYSLRNCWIKDAVRGVVYSNAGTQTGMWDVDRCLFTGRPGGSLTAAAINISGTTGTTALRLKDSIFDWECQNTNGGKYVLDCSTSTTQVQSGGNNYVWYTGATDASSNWTPYTTDIETNGSTLRPTYDGYGQQLTTSPAYRTAPLFQTGVLDDAGIFYVTDCRTNGTLTAGGALTRTATTFEISYQSFTYGGAGAGDPLQGYTLMALPGGAAEGVNGQWREIQEYSYDPNTGASAFALVTVVPPLSSTPGAGQRFIIGPPMWPRSGNIASMFTPGLRVEQGPPNMAMRDLFNTLTIAGVKIDRGTAFPEVGLHSPGPFSDIVQSLDFRWSGDGPTNQTPFINQIQAVVQPPPSPGGGGGGGRLGRFQKPGVD